MLETLLDVETAYSIIQRNANDEGYLLDAYYKQLKTDIEVLSKDSEEYAVIEQYVVNIQGLKPAFFSNHSELI